MPLKRRTRLAGISILAVSSLVLAACGSDDGGDDGGESTDAIISINSIEPQNPLIPTATNEVGGGNVIDLIFAGLVAYNPDGTTELEVAESIESDDNQNWTITLEEGWTFSDGSPVTADSFVDAWNYGALSTNAHLGSYFFYPIEGFDAVQEEEPEVETLSGLEVVDELTFTVALSEPEALFPERLGYSSYYPLPESAFEDMDAFGESPIGNGPYMLDGEDAWQHDVQISLVPNPEYDGEREAQNGGVNMVIYTNADAAFTDVQAGNLDILDQVPPSALTTFQDDSSVQAFSQPGSVNATITIPERLPGFSGEEGQLRRQALSKAINREEVTEAIFDGSRTPASDFSSPLMPGFTEDIEGADVLDFDAEEAQALWAEAEAIAPFDGAVQLAYNADGAGNQEWVEAVVNQWANNLEIDASPVQIPTFAELRTSVTDRSIQTPFRTGWQPDYPSVYNYLGPIFGTGAGSNDGDYSNADFDDLLTQALSAEGQESYDLLAEAQAILFVDLPAIPLWNTNVSAAAAIGVENVVFNWQNRPELHLVTK